MKKRLTAGLLSLVLSGVLLLAGCGSKGNDTSPQTSSQQQGSAKLNEEVYEGSVLSGTVMNYGDGEFSVLAIQEETADDGGEIAIMPAPGSEGENNTTKVTYGEDCEFQVVRIDASQEKAPEYQEASAGDVQKLTEVIVFGEKLSSGEVQADKVLIADIYNKDKMPGSY